MQKAENELDLRRGIVNPKEWRFRQFEVRADGLVFWAYDKTYKTGERWVTWDEAIRLKNHRNWRSRNNPKTKERWKQWYQRNKDYKDAQTKAWQKANKRHLSKYSSKRNAQKLLDDPVFAMKQRLRKRTSKAFKLMGYAKSSRSSEILGCEWEELKKHIESMFSKGMSWENRHLWHIDHIIPLASARSEEHLKKLCHYSNLQPLWAMENWQKSSKH